MRGVVELCVFYIIAGPANGAVGDSDFSALVKSKTFVDKTLLAQELFNHDYIVVTAPRGFGKSTNIDMLKKFFRVKMDDAGQPIANVLRDDAGGFVENVEHLTDNYKLFRNNNLNIYKNKPFFYEHCNNHTVVHASFKNVGRKTYEAVVEQLQLVVSRAFQEHRYLLDLIEDEEDRTRFVKHLEHYRQLTVPETQIGLSFLVRLLNQLHRKKPIVLFDDFDAPVADAVYHSYKDVGKTIELLRVLYSHLLIENRNLQRAFISAGNIKFVRLLCVYTNYDKYYPLFPNEFEYFPFLSNAAFTQHYAFTVNEVTSLLEKFGLFERYKEVETYFGGYTIHGSNLKLFNGFAVLEFLKNGTVQNYWSGVKDLKEIFTNRHMQDKIDALLSGSEITLPNTPLTVDYALTLHRIFKKPLGHKLKDPDNPVYGDAFVHFLADSGYFNVVEGEETKLRLPNKEIADDLSDKLHTVTFYMDKYNYDFLKIEEFAVSLRSLNVNDPQTFAELARLGAALYTGEAALPENDFEFFSRLYVFAKVLGKFETIAGRSHAIGPRDLDVLIVRKDGVAIALQTRVGSGTAQDSLKTIVDREYYKLIKPSYGDVSVKDKIYIGVHLSKKREFSVSYLVNSLDLSAATSLVR